MNFDRESIKQRLINGLRAKNAWANILDTSVLDGLVTPFAEEENRIALYNEYLQRETRWNLAQNLTSLTTQSTINGYTPQRKTGAQGKIKISVSETFDSSPAVAVQIPKNTIFSNGEVDVAAVDTYVITSSDDFIEVEVIQGTPLSSSFTAQGINFEEFDINNDSVENDFYEVTVNGVLWSEIDDIREAGSEDTVYEVLDEFNFSGVKIRFGNSINGQRLSLGDSIVFNYYETLGPEGNIVASDVITSVESTIYNTNDDRVEVFCTNEEPIIGGSNYDSVEDVRRKSPLFNQSQNSATTLTGYRVFIESLPFIYRGVVSGALEYNIDNGFPYSQYIPSEDNKVRISAFTGSGDQLTESQQLEIITSLRDSKAPTDIIEFEPVEFIRLKFFVNAVASDRKFYLSTVRNTIESFLEETYSLFNWDFKKPIYESDYKADIDRIKLNDEYILSHHTTTIKLIQETSFSGAYLADLNLHLPPVEEGSIEVWINKFISEPGYDLGSSAVNYFTGAGILEVTSGLVEDFEDYEIRFIYELSVLDILPTKRNQILMYDSADIQLSYLSDF